MFKAFLLFPLSISEQTSKIIHFYHEFMAQYYMKNYTYFNLWV